MFQYVLTFVFLSTTFTLCYFYIRYFIPLAKVKANKNKNTSLNYPLSVIIAAKNEIENLKQYLTPILNQDYPEFEVIVVDDHSADESIEFLKSLKSERLTILEQTKGVDGKKAAIQFGVRHAKYDHLVFTDADCVPASRNWLRELASNFSTEKQIVLGYGRFFKQKGILNKLIRFEGLLNAIQYFSFALAGKPYMGVGRNLAYIKLIAEDSTSLEKHNNIRSGDDDLIINEMANSKNVSVVIGPDSHTYSQAKKSWKSYYFQKRRQLQAGAYYKKEDRLRLLVFGLSNLLFYLSFLWLIFLGIDSVIIIIGFIGKVLIQLFVFKKIMAKLGDEDLLFWALILDVVYLIQISLIGASTFIWKVDRWK